MSKKKKKGVVQKRRERKVSRDEESEGTIIIGMERRVQLKESHDLYEALSENERLQRQLAMKNLELDMWKRRCEELQKENEVLRDSYLKRIKTLEESVHVFQGESERKSDEIVSLRKENKSLKRMIQDKEVEIRELRKHIDELRDTLEKQKVEQEERNLMQEEKLENFMRIVQENQKKLQDIQLKMSEN